MAGGSLAKLLGALATVLYLAWLLKRGLRTGVLDSPGAGASVRRDRNPRLFALTVILCCIAIALALLVAATTLARG